jgi:hypothetical protein
LGSRAEWRPQAVIETLHCRLLMFLVHEPKCLIFFEFQHITPYGLDDVEYPKLKRFGFREVNISLYMQNSFIGVNDVWLRTGEGDMFSKVSSSGNNELLSIFNELSPAVQDILLDYA